MKPIVISQGSTAQIQVQFFKPGTSQLFGDITGATPITASFIKSDGTLLVLALGAGVTLTSGPGALLTIALSAAQTLLLKADATLLQDFEVAFTLAGATYVRRLQGVLSILPALTA